MRVCVCACACSPADQSADEDLIPSANHMKVLLNVIICTLRRRGEGGTSQGVSCLHFTLNCSFVPLKMSFICHPLMCFCLVLSEHMKNYKHSFINMMRRSVYQRKCSRSPFYLQYTENTVCFLGNVSLTGIKRICWDDF